MKIAAVVKYLTLLTGFVCTSINAAPISFSENTNEGMDNALQSAFNRAVETVSPGTKPDLSLEAISPAIVATSLNNGMLSVTFDDAKIKELLEGAGIPSWNGIDEPVLLWFTSVADGSVISNPDSYEAVKSFVEAANKKSIRVMFPVMDLDDIQHVSSQTILTHNDEALKNASSRYDAKYYIAGAVNRNDSGEYEYKVNVYAVDGRSLGSAQRKGAAQEVGELLADDIVQVFINNQSSVQNDTAAAPNGLDAPSQTLPSDSLTPGAYHGFVRILVSGIENIQDYKAIQSALITFGYEASTKIRGYTQAGAIIDIPTEASPSILDGTLAHSGEFTKEGEWRYHWNRSVGKASTGRDGIGQATADRIISNPDPVKPVQTEVSDKTGASAQGVSSKNGAEVLAVSD